jgi:tetratricopeptide (TPR) repeat protein
LSTLRLRDSSTPDLLRSPALARLSARWSANPADRCFAAFADGLRKAGALAEAADVARQGLAAHPEFVPGLLTLSRILVEQGDQAAARDTLQAALAIDPGHPVVLESLGRLAVRAKPVSTEAREEDDDVAAPSADTLDVADHSAPPPIAGDTSAALDDDHGELLYAVDDDADDLALDDDDDTPPLFTESLAMVYRRQGHLDRAVEVLDTLFDRDPSNAALGERRDAARAERDAGKPRPYDVSQSGGQSMAQWLAAVAAVKVARPPVTSGLDAFYQAPNSSGSEASDLAAFQAWLKELEG